jgi:hypothetical protein
MIIMFGHGKSVDRTRILSRALELKPTRNIPIGDQQQDSSPGIRRQQNERKELIRSLKGKTVG